MPLSAKKLIENKRTEFVLPSKKALAEFEEILKHNDSLGEAYNTKRVNRVAACELLSSWGYPCSKERLDKLCKALGRKSYGYA